MSKFDPSKVHNQTEEEKIQTLMSYGYPKEKATEIVKAGKYKETVDQDYMALAGDPIGVLNNRLREEYFSRTSDPEKAQASK